MYALMEVAKALVVFWIGANLRPHCNPFLIWGYEEMPVAMVRERRTRQGHHRRHD